MKHELKITLTLLGIYVLAQVIGLALINLDLDVSMVDNKPVIQHSDTVLGARPEMSGMSSFIYIVLGVAAGTLLILLIIKFRKMQLWKFWFWLASFLAMALALGVLLNHALAALIALALAAWKVYRPNIILHNITEVLMYSGLAVFLVPLFDLTWAIAMLIAFSLYDMYAVWKSKHMVKMAEFQANSNLFAGLTIPYKSNKMLLNTKKLAPLKSKKSIKTAILGGGDIAFPLIFTGVVMEWLIIKGMEKLVAFCQGLIIVVFSAAALLFLFMLSKKEKFYPAMPFITGGCFIGLAIVTLVRHIFIV